jgi:hypothetical protein
MPAMQGGELGGQYATDRDRLAQLAQAVVLVAGPGDSGLREP